MRSRLCLALFLTLSVCFAGNVWAEAADNAALIKKGKRLYLKCLSCHDITDSNRAKIGPNLKGIVGKKIASVETFKNYSKAFKSLPLVWDEEALSTWLEDPEAITPGTYMAFVGLPNPEDRKALIEYIKSAK